MLIRSSLIVLIVLSAGLAAAQPAKRAPDSSGLGLLPALIKKAEAGDVKAQLALAEKLVTSSRPADALNWYRKAGEQGYAEAWYKMGEILMHGTPASGRDQTVAQNPHEGIGWIFAAATNQHVLAYRKMSLALQKGLGVRTNLVEARAWLLLYAEKDPRGRQAELDLLSLQLNSQELDAAQHLATSFKRGDWPKLAFDRPPASDVRLKLSGLIPGGHSPLAIINKKTLAQGEWMAIPVATGLLNIRCVKILAESVVVEIQGEPEHRLLSLN